MRYTIELKPAAIRDLKRLPHDVRRRVALRIDALGDTPRPPGVDKLAGPEGFLRIRVGDYRIIYQVRDDVLWVLVIRVRHRREVYRGL